MEQLSRFARWIGSAEAEDAGAEEDPFILEESEEAREEQVEHLLQQFSVLLEYERLPDLIPSGIYVMPSFDSVLTWHGTLFVRQGLYRGGIFKFQLKLLGNYPESPPELHFMSDVFHPMVDPETGRVDLGAFFPEWRPGRHYASFALPHLHRALLRREYFAGGVRPPLNPEARELFLGDPGAYAERARACARSSLRRAHESVPGSPLQFAKGPVEAHEKILENLRAFDTSYSLEDRKTMFVQWFCDHYAKEQIHVHMSQEEAETVPVEAEHDGQMPQREATTVGGALAEAGGPT